jgi:hypothetical protein
MVRPIRNAARMVKSGFKRLKKAYGSRGAQVSRPACAVSTRRPKTAQFLGFSGAIGRPRECRPWRLRIKGKSPRLIRYGLRTSSVTKPAAILQIAMKTAHPISPSR